MDLQKLKSNKVLLMDYAITQSPLTKSNYSIIIHFPACNDYDYALSNAYETQHLMEYNFGHSWQN